jgi:hypothetical protein
VIKMKTYHYGNNPRQHRYDMGLTNAAWDSSGRIVGEHGSQFGPHADPAPTGIFAGCDGSANDPARDGYRLILAPDHFVVAPSPRRAGSTPAGAVPAIGPAE